MNLRRISNCCGRQLRGHLVSGWHRASAVVLVWLVLVPVAILVPGGVVSAAEPEASVPALVVGERMSGASSLASAHTGLRVAFGDLPEICNEARFANVGICATGGSPAPDGTVVTDAAGNPIF